VNLEQRQKEVRRKEKAGAKRAKREARRQQKVAQQAGPVKS
jgi:hypothetical protein